MAELTLLWRGVSNNGLNNNDDENNNNNNDFQQLLNDCGCCEDIRTKKITPLKIGNSPGLSSVRYRVGTHTQFKATMLAPLSKDLPALKTREDDNLAIGILDAWATVADVLTFYEERIANEVFLRTATERRSILELARAIGYELKPGVAASTFLAFTIDDTSKTLERAVIDQGTKVQSIPEDGKLPQIFETAEKLEAFPEWNDLRPRLTSTQSIKKDTSRFYFNGSSMRLKAGDGMLVVKAKDSLPFIFGIVGNVKVDARSQQTIVDIIPVPLSQQHLPDVSGDIGTASDFKVYALLRRTGPFGDTAPRNNTSDDTKIVPEEGNKIFLNNSFPDIFAA